MKEKILAQLVTKYPGVSKKFLGLLADKLAAKATEESQIEDVVNGLDDLPVPVTDLAAEFQREGDRRVSDAEREWKKKNPPKPAPKTEDPPKDDPAPADEAPAWARSMMQELQALKADKVKGTIREKLKEKLKDIPEDYYSEWALPEDEDGMDAFAEKVTTKYTAWKQKLINDGLMNETPPENGQGGKPGEKAASKEEIDAIMPNLM